VGSWVMVRLYLFNSLITLLNNFKAHYYSYQLQVASYWEPRTGNH